MDEEVQDLYEVVQKLSKPNQLRLASLILHGLTEPPGRMKTDEGGPFDRFLELADKLVGKELPPDLAENHQRYLGAD